MATDLAPYNVRDRVATITLNRPEKRNALSIPLVYRVVEGLARFRSDSQARCLLLTGTGPAFCSGVDMEELAHVVGEELPWGPTETVAIHLQDLMDRLYNLDKPTIAVVNGPAVGGGAGLVMACDLAIAGQGAWIGFPEVSRGMVATILMAFLIRHVGERVANHLLLTGQAVAAAEAWGLGLIGEVVPDEHLAERAWEYGRLMASLPPQALATTKRLIHEQYNVFRPTAMERTGNLAAGVLLTSEAREGIRSFLEKRPPRW